MANVKLSYEVKDNIAYLGLGYNCTKSMTVLDQQTLEELDATIDGASKDKSLKGLIFFSHKDSCFLAGADIKLIAAMETETDAAYGAEVGQKLFNKIEDLKIPTVVCIHGVCLGGGLELSLSCNHILVSDHKSTRLALPEVKLGLIPGFGGTYRLPKKVGLPTALDMILSGKMIDARKSVKMELATAKYPKERLITQALLLLKKKKESKGFGEMLEGFAKDNFVSQKIVFQKARENVLKKTKGFYQAPLKILDVMEAGVMKGRSSYLSTESQAFGELCVGEQSKNLQHLFFLTEAQKKYSGPTSNGNLVKLERGACLGAGTMGGGIAWLMADNLMAPIMKDLNVEGLKLGLKQASSNFRSALKRRKLSSDDFERKQRSIRPQMDYRGFKKVDLVIEAVVENMDIKKKVFAEAEKELRSDCIITSNTSSLSVQEMSTALSSPERFAGLHFFNPVHRMPLVEIITHDKVSPETLEALYNWVLKVKKTPIIVKDGPGFLVNRILMPFLNEAGHLLEEGVSVKDIDKACLNFGMPMGPCRLMDEVGIDVGVKVAKIIYDGLGERVRPANLLNNFVEANFLGRKTSKGFYNYNESGKDEGINSEITKFLPKKSKSMSENDIQMRVFLPMINEASSCLQDKIVSRAQDVDLGLIFGLGFPPFRGGLLKYADSQGLNNIVEAMNKFQEVDKDRYMPSDYLLNLVKQEKSFYS